MTPDPTPTRPDPLADRVDLANLERLAVIVDRRTTKGTATAGLIAQTRRAATELRFAREVVEAAWDWREATTVEDQAQAEAILLARLLGYDLHDQPSPYQAGGS